MILTLINVCMSRLRADLEPALKFCSENERAGIPILDQDLSLNISKSKASKQVLKSISVPGRKHFCLEKFFKPRSEVNTRIHLRCSWQKLSVLVER